MVLVTLAPKSVILKLLEVTHPFESDGNLGHSVQTNAYQEFRILATFSPAAPQLTEDAMARVGGRGM